MSKTVMVTLSHDVKWLVFLSKLSVTWWKVVCLSLFKICLVKIIFLRAKLAVVFYVFKVDLYMMVKPKFVFKKITQKRSRKQFVCIEIFLLVKSCLYSNKSFVCVWGSHTNTSSLNNNNNKKKERKKKNLQHFIDETLPPLEATEIKLTCRSHVLRTDMN